MQFRIIFMLESKLSYLVDPLREMIYQFDVIISGYREQSGALMAGLTCDMLPAEITASLGFVPVRIPSLITGRCTAAGISALHKIDGIYDCVVVPRGCAGRDSMPDLNIPLHEFLCPPGWGDEARRIMETALDELLLRAGCTGISGIDSVQLRDVTNGYNAHRRLVRGITTVRRDKPDLLSCRDLAIVHEAAQVFPPSVVAGHLATILDILNTTESGRYDCMVPALVYASFTGNAAVLDEIEEAGCLIVEDDACGGRRQFDMSYNHESPDLLGEILDAFSYRPRCPSVRPVGERIELFYSMLKSHGIELVIFIEDFCCPARQRDIESLRIRLMRSGVDPMVVSSKDAVVKIRDYVSKI
jgi:hypothetical protein